MDKPLKIKVYQRLQAEGRWKEAEPVRDALMKEARRNGLEKLAAQDWAYNELDRRFPPPGQAAATNSGDQQPQQATTAATAATGDVATSVSAETTSQRSARPRDSAEASVMGLSDMPDDWPSLPPNAPLAVEVSWVQANRLRCVREMSDRVVVDLSRSLSPAPSYAALGWLETSIKTYAKFVDVAAKATAGADSEMAEIRREQLAIDEVRKLLEEMVAS